MTSQRSLSIAMLCWILLLGGCAHKQSTNEVTGSVLVDKKPANGAIVTLIPKNNPDSPTSVKPTGTVQEDGSFKLTTYKTDDGAPAGDYIVLVEWTTVNQKTKAEKSLLPIGYADPKKTNLVVTIKPGPNKLEPFELSSRSQVNARNRHDH